MALDTTTPVTELTIDGVSIPLKGVTVYDGLDSTNTEYCLSANQGKVLNEKITSAKTEANNYTDEKFATFENYDDTEVRQLITDLDNDKVEKDGNKVLSTNDYTTAEKEKLAGLNNYNDTEVKNLITTNYNTLTASLANYYLKSETYSKNEVNDLINTITSFNAVIVTVLPTSNISTNTIYLIAKSDSETNDYYDEYLYINNAWEMIGNTKIDLSDYYNKTQIDTKVDTINSAINGKAASDHLHTDVYAPATHEHTQYALGTTVSNLETNLSTNYVTKTTVATADTYGLVKVSYNESTGELKIYT